MYFSYANIMRCCIGQKDENRIKWSSSVNDNKMCVFSFFLFRCFVCLSQNYCAYGMSVIQCDESSCTISCNTIDRDGFLWAAVSLFVFFFFFIRCCCLPNGWYYVYYLHFGWYGSYSLFLACARARCRYRRWACRAC